MDSLINIGFLSIYVIIMLLEETNTKIMMNFTFIFTPISAFSTFFFNKIIPIADSFHLKVDILNRNKNKTNNDKKNKNNIISFILFNTEN